MTHALRKEGNGLPDHLHGIWVHPQHPGPWRALRLTRLGNVAMRQDTDGPPKFTSAAPEDLTVKWDDRNK